LRAIVADVNNRLLPMIEAIFVCYNIRVLKSFSCTPRNTEYACASDCTLRCSGGGEGWEKNAQFAVLETTSA